MGGVVSARGLDRERARRRGTALAAACAVSLVAGIVVGASSGDPARDTATGFTSAWQHGRYAVMRRLTVGAPDLARFRGAFAHASATATATGVRFGRPEHAAGSELVVPAVVATRVFGTLHLPLRLRIADDGEHVLWSPALAFPGLRQGERLTRRLVLPPRAALLARDGTPLAAGASRSSPLGATAAQIAGSLGRLPADGRQALYPLGVPPDARVGTTGLERIFESRLRGRPGGMLLAGARVIGRAREQPAAPVRTTISPAIERAAATALGGRLGGVVALRPRTGEVLAAAGIAWSALQPPGSTFKVITLTGVLEAGIARPTSSFPVRTAALLSGVPLSNANGEACGGTLVQAFAESCNSVFAPLGARLGAQRLVDVARRFGFDHPPGIPGAETSTLPDADRIGDELAVGSTAIGQGQVQSTTLEMGVVAATIADGGRRPTPVLALGQRVALAPVTTPAVAHTVRRMMIDVVREGTGTSAALPNVTVAGKTGTAELRNTRGAGATSSDPSNTDAWFVAFAPASAPRIAVGVLVVGAGAGGAAAAPVARAVLQAAVS